MIKANELRIGNLVKSSLNIIEVIGLGEERANLILRLPNTGVNWCMLYDDLSGIPLTEEILLKCGYKVVNRNERFIAFEGGHYLYLIDNMVKMSTGIEMHYLHELQNRVFSLTGEELNTSELI